MWLWVDRTTTKNSIIKRNSLCNGYQDCEKNDVYILLRYSHENKITFPVILTVSYFLRDCLEIVLSYVKIVTEAFFFFYPVAMKLGDYFAIFASALQGFNFILEVIH